MTREERVEVVTDATSWIGTRYMHNCCVKGVGVDCGQLLRAVYNPWCGPLPPAPAYASDWSLHKDVELFLDYLKPFSVEVSQREAEAGDAAIVRYGRAWSHAAIYVGGGMFVHALGHNNKGEVSLTSGQRFGNRRIRYFSPLVNHG